MTPRCSFRIPYVCASCNIFDGPMAAVQNRAQDDPKLICVADVEERFLKSDKSLAMDIVLSVRQMPEAAHERYEFGTKVSIATTIEEGFVLSIPAMAGNPYDGHTLAEALEQVEIQTDQRPTLALVDRGYRGHGVEKTKVLISETRRGLTPKLTKLLRRRSAIEPEKGHIKGDGRLAKCLIKGIRSDAIFAVLCGCGHNIRKILRYLRSLFFYLIAAIITGKQSTTCKAAGDHASPSAATA